MKSVIELKKINKQFKEKQVLTDISLNIGKGECVALLGKNGAGKSTLLNIILGLFYPTTGEIAVNETKQDIGFLSQKTQFPDDVTVQEMLDFVSSFSSNPLDSNEIDTVLGFEKNKYKQLVYTCSGGEQRLFDMCLAIINRPKLLIIDEPTSGMDTSTRQHFWQLVKQLKEAGTTIFFTTHYIEEVDYCADRVILLDEGVIQADNTPYHLRTLNKKKVITIEKEIYQEFEESLSNLIIKNQLSITTKNDVLVIIFKNEQTNEVISELLQTGIPFDNIEITNTSLLETIFQSGIDKERSEVDASTN
ncbi:ABC transporter ATP-binding protein [Vagococcus carniphilus]|uniref:ABC transporter n=1 Tax=Vagococcus carniphilus TaxID=218144 RepID=A0A430B062_9ENTE|nr:ABC transporter ATP-binding protein [Vagococcus carniphilus]QNN72966.1 ABC transporter ATP-binding protein [Vagococcus carniphilus]RSU13612.1 ABC transporter [Vagococcus carniphilus]